MGSRWSSVAIELCMMLQGSSKFAVYEKRAQGDYCKVDLMLQLYVVFGYQIKT